MKQIETATEEFTQKEVAQVLDRMAARSSNPATGKQCWFLAKLIVESGDAATWIAGDSVVLSKSKASAEIDLYLGNK